MRWITTAIFALCMSPAPASAQGCDSWLLPEFWLRAGAVEVMGCEGRRVDERGEGGVTAMHLAAGYGFVSAVNALALRDAVVVNWKDAQGATPLHYAAEFNANPEMITALLSLGANPTILTSGGEYPYDFAVENRALQGTEALESLHAAITPLPSPPELCDYWPSSDFWLDVTLEKVKACLPYESINARGHYDETPLMWALLQPEPDIAIVRVLLSQGPDLELTDVSGSTALFYAVGADRPDLVALLLAKGANPNVVNENDERPQDLSKSEMVKRLIAEYSAQP